MLKPEVDEATKVAKDVINALLDTLSSTSVGADLKYACGQLADNAAPLIATDVTTFFANLAQCFELARIAGSTVAAMDRVRLTALSALVNYNATIAVRNFSVRMSLAEEAQIIASSTFTSREDIDTLIDTVNNRFDQAEVTASDNLDNVSLRALISLHAAVVNDLNSRAEPLPRMVHYSFARRFPSLWVVQRLYQDASRNGEVVAENKVVHPLFCPPNGRCLSA